MIRIAAVGDLHYSSKSVAEFREAWAALSGKADLLLLAGDLTRNGKLDEAQALCRDLAECPVPILAVLGNHEYQCGNEARIVELLAQVRVQVLDGQSSRILVGGRAVAITGIKGFGGGFMGACASEFGEPEMKDFSRHSREQGEKLRQALAAAQGDHHVVLLHFSPVEATLLGEKREIYPFLGSYHLAEPLDEFGVELAIHGHAHRGVESGRTAGGVPVKNVAFPVIRAPYRVYSLEHRPAPVVKPGAWASTMS